MEKTEEHFDGHVAVKCILIFENKFLMVQGVSSNGKWDLPGGHLHKDETPQQGLEREVKEELGIAVTAGNIVYTEHFFHPGPQRNTLMLVYICRAKEEKIEPAADELKAASWFSKEELLMLPVYQNCSNAIRYYFENQSE